MGRRQRTIQPTDWVRTQEALDNVLATLNTADKDFLAARIVLPPVAKRGGSEHLPTRDDLTCVRLRHLDACATSRIRSLFVRISSLGRSSVPLTKRIHLRYKRRTIRFPRLGGRMRLGSELPPRDSRLPGRRRPLAWHGAAKR